MTTVSEGDRELPDGVLRLEDIPDTELPGMWERADFEGGQDEVRGPDWKPPASIGKEKQ